MFDNMCHVYPRVTLVLEDYQVCLAHLERAYKDHQ